MSTATAPTVRTHERRRWSREADRRGWRHSTSSYRCPLEVAGAHCWHRPEINYPGGCVCDALSQRRALEHVRRWTDRTGYPVVTAEIVGLADEHTAEIQTFCSAFGIEVGAAAYSPYWPGRTTLLIFRGRAGR
jgi:hypothetical protein